MASPEAVKKPRRTTFSKMASIFCFVEPRVHERASSPLNAEPHKTGAIEHMGKVDALVKARTSLVLGTPVNLVEATQLHSLKKGELQGQKDYVADLAGKLQRLTDELKDAKAHSAQLQAKVDALVEARTSLPQGTPVTLVKAAQLHSPEGEVQRQRNIVADLRGKLQRLTDELKDEKAHSAQLQAKVADLEIRKVVGTMVAAAVQRAAVCAEMEEEKIVTDMVTGIMHRATLHEAQAFHADLLEAAQRTSLELQVKNDELALAREEIQRHKADNAVLNQACFQNLPTVMEEDCPMANHLGSGSCGTVDLHSMTVAIKKPRTAADVRALEAEHLSMATMNHPHIPRSLAAWQPSDGGPKGIIMRYIPGGSLSEQLMRCDPRGVQHRHECLCILMQLLDVLQYAHGLGRVHADIKTTNLMYQAGQLTLIDWGVSYLITEPAVCWRGSVGTLRAVAAVEPWKRGFADDVRGFWAVAYELLTAQSVVDILRKQYLGCNSQPHLEEALTQLCEEANLDPTNHRSRLLCAEYHEFIRIEKVEFLDLAADEDVPRPFLEMLMHGLSSAVSRGDAPTSSLEEIRSVLVASTQELETKMKPPLVPDTVYRSEPEAIAARQPRQSRARRRLDFGGEAEPEAAAAACTHMPPAPEAADPRKWRNFVAALAAACADEAPKALDISDREEPAAAAASLADMLPDTLDSPEREMPEAAAAAPGHALPFTLDFGDVRQRWAQAVSPDRAAPGDTGEPDAAADPCARMPAGPLDTRAACSALVTQQSEVPYMEPQLPDTLDVDYRAALQPAAASPQLQPHTQETADREGNTWLSMHEGHVVDLGFLD